MVEVEESLEGYLRTWYNEVLPVVGVRCVVAAI